VLELRGALPEGVIEPYPVATDELDARRWWRTGGGARRMVLEYCKYLVILTREAILSLGPKERPRPAGPIAHRLPLPQSAPGAAPDKDAPRTAPSRP